LLSEEKTLVTLGCKNYVIISKKASASGDFVPAYPLLDDFRPPDLVTSRPP